MHVAEVLFHRGLNKCCGQEKLCSRADAMKPFKSCLVEYREAKVRIGAFEQILCGTRACFALGVLSSKHVCCVKF